MKQINLNNDYENEIRKAINESMPFVSDIEDLSLIKSEYAENKF